MFVLPAHHSYCGLQLSCMLHSFAKVAQSCCGGVAEPREKGLLESQHPLKGPAVPKQGPAGVELA